MKINNILSIGMGIIVCMTCSSCLSDDPNTIIVENAKPSTDIPKDEKAIPNPDVNDLETLRIPNFQHTTVLEDGLTVLRIDMTGVQDNNSLEWFQLYGTDSKNQNVWVEVDGKPKGIKVYNSSDTEEQHTVPVDLIFTIDNSGSMDEEADAIATQISDWANRLQMSGLNIRFACVGYDVSGNISGALSFTDAQGVYSYLNRYGVSGTYRTVGFVGTDYDIQKYNRVKGNYSCPDECGLAAIRFADEQFNFRSNANRIYVNFTDEPNQNGSNYRFDVESLKTDWDTNRGTIHTVYSGGYDENNYLMSEYTGGTVLNVDSSFYNVTLDSLPVTDAMKNSYIIRFTDIDEYLDGRPHTVKITVISPDGMSGAERTFVVTFGDPIEDDPDNTDHVGSYKTFNGGFGEFKGESDNTHTGKQTINLKGSWEGTNEYGDLLIIHVEKNGSGYVWRPDEYEYFINSKVEDNILWLMWEDEDEFSDEGDVIIIDKNTFKLGNKVDNQWGILRRK